MSIKVVWDNEEKTILRFERHKGWTLEDYYQSINEAVAILEKHPYKVHVIQDATLTSQMPTNAMVHFRAGNSKLAPYSEKTVIVGNSLFMEVLFAMFKQVNVELGKNFAFVESREKAHEYLSEFVIDTQREDQT